MAVVASTIGSSAFHWFVSGLSLTKHLFAFLVIVCNHQEKARRPVLPQAHTLASESPLY